VWSFARQRSGATVYRTEVRLPNLPAHLNGLTICQLSDLHCGPLCPEEQIKRGVALAMSLEADLIALTGDYVWRGAEHADACGRALRALEAMHGVYAVLGNHDYWCGDVGRVKRALSDAGIHVLLNDKARMEAGGEAWWLCGVDDVWAGEPDLEATLAGVPEKDFKIMLCHEPDFADSAIGRNISLQLSGHSHGGQVRLPLVGAPYLVRYARRYPMGLQKVKGSDLQVYTNVGLGVVLPPVRFNCRPEVTHLTLTRT
jgi:predicted MPP superfamily phosphohydrolase